MPSEAPERLHPDRSGLSTAERNAVILRSKGAKEAAAKALGWTAGRTREVGRCEEFLEREIARIREKVKAIAERRAAAPAPTVDPPKPKRREPVFEETIEETAPAPCRSEVETVLISTIEGRVAELENELGDLLPAAEERGRLLAAKAALELPTVETPPDQLDEREAEPPPPPGEKLDEREEVVPPPPPTPPIREDDPEDEARIPSVDEVRSYIEATFAVGERFKAGQIREHFPRLTRITTTHRLNVLLAPVGPLGFEGQRGGTRYFRV
jgi:hypothetical protein